MSRERWERIGLTLWLLVCGVVAVWAIAVLILTD